MSPMVDRLVAAVDRELDVSETVLADPLTLRRLKAQRLVRVLLAHLRTPTQFMVNAGSVARWPEDREGRTEDIWRAMIDAAELEKPDA